MRINSRRIEGDSAKISDQVYEYDTADVFEAGATGFEDAVEAVEAVEAGTVGVCGVGFVVVLVGAGFV